MDIVRRKCGLLFGLTNRVVIINTVYGDGLDDSRYKLALFEGPIVLDNGDSEWSYPRYWLSCIHDRLSYIFQPLFDLVSLRIEVSYTL